MSEHFALPPEKLSLQAEAWLPHHDEELPAWSSPRPGIQIRELYADEKGYRAALVCFSPKAEVPMHRHTADEHVFVLQGLICDETRECGPGTYIRNSAGTSHKVWSNTGGLVLIHWLGPIQFLQFHDSIENNEL